MHRVVGISVNCRGVSGLENKYYEMGHKCTMPLKSKNIFTLEFPWLYQPLQRNEVTLMAVAPISLVHNDVELERLQYAHPPT